MMFSLNVSTQLNYSHGYFTNYGLILGKPQPWLLLQSTFPQTGVHLLEIPIIKLVVCFCHCREMKSNKTLHYITIGLNGRGDECFGNIFLYTSDSRA